MNTSSMPTVAQSRRLWLIVWGALTLAAVMYSVIAQMLGGAKQAPATFETMRTVFVGLAAAAFAAGTFVMSRAGSPGGWPPGLPPSPQSPDLAPAVTFQTRTIIAMALFESIAIYGFILVTMGGPPMQILPWSAATIVGMLGVVLPQGLSYWRRAEDAERSGRSPIG